MIKEIKKTDVVELYNDNVLYFVVNVKGDSIVLVYDESSEKTVDRSNVVNVWKLGNG